MTVGENIRRIRQQRGLSVKQLASMLGISDTYLRFYENGTRVPKRSSLEKISRALDVNPAVLMNADTNPITDMHRLFHVFKQHHGSIYSLSQIEELLHSDELKIDKDNFKLIHFESINLLISSWYEAYEKYKNGIEQAKLISDPVEMANEILKIQNEFDWWMDTYPSLEPNQGFIEAMSIFNEASNYIGTHPLNDPEYPVSEDEKNASNNQLRAIYDKFSDIKYTL